MSVYELPPDDDADRYSELVPDDAAALDQWEDSDLPDGIDDDGTILRDDEDPTSGQFGELAEDDVTDRFYAEPAAIDDATDHPNGVPATNRLESVFAASSEDVWATRPEREAEIMGYPKVSDEVAERGHHNAEMQKNVQLTGVYELAGHLQRYDHGEAEDPGMAASADGSQTWYTDSGNLSIHHESDVEAEDDDVRQRLIDMEGLETQDGILKVHAQRFVPYTESGDQVEVNVRVTFQTEGDRVYWKDLSSGFVRPEDGSPCPEGEEAILGQFALDKLPPGVTVDQAVENVLLSYVWDATREAFSYASQDREQIDNEGLSEALDQDERDADATAEAIEAEQAAEAEAPDDLTIRNMALQEAGQQLLAYEHQESKGYDTYDAARAYADLVDVAARMGNTELVAGYTQMLEAVEEVSETTLMHAYFTGSTLGDPESLTKIDTLLTGEMIERMDDDDDSYGLLGADGLRQLIHEYEERGISPDTLIADRSLNAEERWMQTTYHQHRTQDTDPQAAEGLQQSLQQFARDGLRDFSPEFIKEMTQYILPKTSDPALRAQMVEQFTSAIDRLPVDSSSYRALMVVGKQVLQDKELTQQGLGQQLHLYIELQTEHHASDYWLMRDRKVWDVTRHAYSDLPADELVSGIQQSIHQSLEQATDEQYREALTDEYGMLLRTGATAYARQGKFADSHTMIAEIGLKDQAGAFEESLQYAKSPLDIARLRPQVDAQIHAYDPDVEMMFEAHEARISGNVTAMAMQVSTLAEAIAKSGNGGKDSTLPDPSRARTQANLLIHTMKSVQPGSELAAARTLVQSMRQSPEFASNLPMLSYTYSYLLDGGTSADHKLVYDIIRDTDASAATKAAQLSKLALRLTS